ncbi:transposase [Tardibacter chloracetimidivorans]|uniref:Transposase n=1 Tax=Tardibacter chloracetimidivorans TaxID=1921510 RepID=A0A1L3ZSL5_9SPHN|nr:DUF2274 domain-containing protein [Tardibacter chloracetimidivorans]API58599.1 transposase [Tardibacter chloracetimidivorans]
MPDIKLRRLPDRTPVKITITLSPELKKALDAYCKFYEKAYGRAEQPAEVASAILAHFLESDRAFQRSRPTAEHGTSSD